MDYQQRADQFRAEAGDYMARADRAMARLAGEPSSDSNEIGTFLRYIYRREAARNRRSAEEALRYAAHYSGYAERRRAEYAGSRRLADDSIRDEVVLGTLSDVIPEEEQLGAQSQRNTDMVPASESAIARVLKRVRVGGDEKDDESEDEGHGDRKRRKVGEKQSCAVCLEEFQEGLEVASTPCSHFFHDQCIGTWLKRRPSCPICRREISVLD